MKILRKVCSIGLSAFLLLGFSLATVHVFGQSKLVSPPVTTEYQINPNKWECITEADGMLIIIPRHTFDIVSGDRVTLKVTRSERLFANGNQVLEFEILASSSGNAVQCRPNRQLYVEFPLPHWNWDSEVVRIDGDSVAHAQPIFPYLVEFPLDELHFHVDCEGAINFRGFGDMLKDPRLQGTVIATREFQNRYELMICELQEFGIYLDNVHEDLWVIDSLVGGYYLRRMLDITESSFAYTLDSTRMRHFDFFFLQRQLGLYPDVRSSDSPPYPRKWKKIERMVRERILGLPKNKWLFGRKYLPILVSPGNSYQFTTH